MSDWEPEINRSHKEPLSSRGQFIQVFHAQQHKKRFVVGIHLECDPHDKISEAVACQGSGGGLPLNLRIVLLCIKQCTWRIGNWAPIWVILLLKAQRPQEDASAETLVCTLGSYKANPGGVVSTHLMSVKPWHYLLRSLQRGLLLSARWGMYFSRWLTNHMDQRTLLVLVGADIWVMALTLSVSTQIPFHPWFGLRIWLAAYRIHI